MVFRFSPDHKNFSVLFFLFIELCTHIAKHVDGDFYDRFSTRDSLAWCLRKLSIAALPKTVELRICQSGMLIGQRNRAAGVIT